MTHLWVVPVGAALIAAIGLFYTKKLIRSSWDEEFAQMFEGEYSREEFDVCLAAWKEELQTDQYKLAHLALRAIAYIESEMERRFG